MSQITTHVLDTSLGRPAAGVPVTLEIQKSGGWQEISKGATDADEVFRFGCACVRSSIWVIHASASSKLEKR